MTATMRRLSGTALLAVAVLAVAGGSATAQSAGWQQALYIPSAPPIQDSQLTTVSVLGPDSAWAVGEEDVESDGGLTRTSLVEHWDGISWQQIAEPTPPAAAHDPALRAVYAQADDDVWVSGSAYYPPAGNAGSFVAQWNGATWTTHDLGLNWSIQHLAVIAADDVWVLGTVGRSLRPVSAHWNGSTWTSGRLPAQPSQGAEYDTTSPAWATARDARSGAPELMHYTGTKWAVATSPTVTLPPGAQGAYFSEVLELDPTNVWLTVGYDGVESIAAGLGLWHWDGVGWSHILELRNEAPAGITTDGAGGLWLLSAGVRVTPRLLHVVDGRVVAKVGAPHPATGTVSLNSIADADSGGAVWAVGAIVTKGKAGAVIERYQP